MRNRDRFSASLSNTSRRGGSKKLSNGARIAVVGGGPSGSFFSYFLLDMAERAGNKFHLDIYEPRDYLKPGPAGCNMCAGIVSETLIQNLATEGIDLPASVVQRGIDSYILHMDVGSVRINTPLKEKRIGAVYRGAGPRDLKEFKFTGLDGHLLSLAVARGAQVINDRVVEADWVDDRPRVRTRTSDWAVYDLVVVTIGVNSPALKVFEDMCPGYRAPRTTKTHLREYFLGAERVEAILGNAVQVFLLDIPDLEFGMLIPKGDYMTLCLLGEEINKEMVRRFLETPQVRACLPPEIVSEKFSCNCSPRINTRAALQPYADRLVFIGDCASTRLFKDGIGSAYRTSKAAAAAVVFHGVSAQDLHDHYYKVCKRMDRDNAIGRLIFRVVSIVQKKKFAREGVLRMIVDEQDMPGEKRRMSTVQWDMYTGSGSYREIFLRTVHPVFLARIIRDSLVSLWPWRKSITNTEIDHETVPTAASGALGRWFEPGELIFRQGDSSDCRYVVMEGQVALMQERDGEDLFLGVRGAGEPLGDMALFEREVHSATVQALTRVRILTVDRDNFTKRIHEDPSLAYRLFQIMSRRTRNLTDQVSLLNQEIDRLSELLRDN